MDKKYDKLVIFYFSGTGNARRVSEWFAQTATENKMSCELINIGTIKSNEIPIIKKDTLVGFCSPTHGFNFPPIFINFLINFPRFHSTDAFIINTRAGMKLYKLFLPGLSGIAQYFAAIILLFKGFRIVGMQPMDLPSNWISLHPGLRKKVVDSIFNRCRRITKSFAAKILSGGTKYKAFWSFPFDIAVAPIAILYYLVGRFALAKTFVASSKCNQCKLCIRECPVKAIKIIGNRPFWTFKCESCMHCMNNCPQRAIETALGFTFILWWGIFSFVPVWINSLLFEGLLKGISTLSILSWVVYNFIYISTSLFLVLISYHVLHFSLKFSFFEHLVAYTSLTRYRWWRRYKAPEEL